MINLYIDAEWFIDQQIFLLGIALEDTVTGAVRVVQLYSRRLLRKNILKLFRAVTGFVFVYGPDIGMLEKFFNYPFRQKFRCINFLKIIKLLEPDLPSYALAKVEKHFGMYRKQQKYKANIFQIYRDWRNPVLKNLVLAYNYEDVGYLVAVKRILFKKHLISIQWLASHALR